MKNIFDILRDPLLSEMEVDGVNRLELHRKMLEKKSMLQDVFIEFHNLFINLDSRFLNGNGLKVELGAGVSPIRDSYPDVLATDIVESPYLDKVINAEAMDFADQSISTIYGQNCFHHFPQPERFFSELERVLTPGGGAILLEPYHGFFATFLFKRLFHTEDFDKECTSWDSSASGPMNGANQALSYIIFIRDLKEFELKFPSLRIVHQEPVGNYLMYLLSGGLNFRQLVPDSFIKFIRVLEKILSPFNYLIALHHVIVIRKLNLN
jgi:SAM-dependent methyltransferase